MSVSIGRKLQALRDLQFPDLKFELVAVALTVEQVRELGLPSTPLKETEKRADRWRDAFGVEQTEIDAIATLRPDILADIIEHAFDPYLDRDLAARVMEHSRRSLSKSILHIWKRSGRRLPSDSEKCKKPSTASISNCAWRGATTLSFRRSWSPRRSSTRPSKGPTFVLKLRALPGTDSIRALRQALKYLLRTHRLKCIDLREEQNAGGKS
jgi:hypothetical protein